MRAEEGLDLVAQGVKDVLGGKDAVQRVAEVAQVLGGEDVGRQAPALLFQELGADTGDLVGGDHGAVPGFGSGPCGMEPTSPSERGAEGRRADHRRRPTSVGRTRTGRL